MSPYSRDVWLPRVYSSYSAWWSLLWLFHDSPLLGFLPFFPRKGPGSLLKASPVNGTTGLHSSLENTPLCLQLTSLAVGSREAETTAYRLWLFPSGSAPQHRAPSCFMNEYHQIHACLALTNSRPLAVWLLHDCLTVTIPFPIGQKQLLHETGKLQFTLLSWAPTWLGL